MSFDKLLSHLNDKIGTLEKFIENDIKEAVLRDSEIAKLKVRLIGLCKKIARNGESDRNKATESSRLDQMAKSRKEAAQRLIYNG